VSEDKAEQLATLLNSAISYLSDPRGSVPSIVQAIQDTATGANSALNGFDVTEEVTDFNQLQAEVVMGFLSRYSPNMLSQEDIEEQIEAMIATSAIDGYVSPQEVLGSLIIAGGIVEDYSYMSAESFQMAAEILEEIGMPEQTDVYGTTLAYYIDAAKNDLQSFVNSFSSTPEPPSAPANNRNDQDVVYKLPDAGQSK